MTLTHRTTAFVPTLALLATVLSCSDVDAQAAALVARAAEFELDTEWETPPGDPHEHSMAGLAKMERLPKARGPHSLRP